MNSINLFPVEEKQTLRAEKLKFSFSFSSYSSYMTISSCDKELTIYLNDQSVRDQGAKANGSTQTQCEFDFQEKEKSARVV